MQVVSLPPCDGSSRLRHSLRPETRAAVFLGRHSDLVAAFFLARALFLVEAMARLVVKEEADR